MEKLFDITDLFTLVSTRDWLMLRWGKIRKLRSSGSIVVSNGIAITP